MSRALLAGLPRGTIVRHEGDWGVVAAQPPGGQKGWRVIDFWWSGREYLPARTVVEVPARQGP